MYLELENETPTWTSAGLLQRVDQVPQAVCSRAMLVALLPAHLKAHRTAAYHCFGEPILLIPRRSAQVIHQRPRHFDDQPKATIVKGGASHGVASLCLSAHGFTAPGAVRWSRSWP